MGRYQAIQFMPDPAVIIIIRIISDSESDERIQVLRICKLRPWDNGEGVHNGIVRTSTLRLMFRRLPLSFGSFRYHAEKAVRRKSYDAVSPPCKSEIGQDCR